MKGLYLNCDKSKALEFVNKIECPYRIDNIPLEIGANSFIISDPFEWKETPTYINREKQIFCACYGWFIYKNEKNNLAKLSNDFSEIGKEVLKEISGGLFIIVLKNKNGSHIISDPFGISNHYYRKENNIFEIAPSPYFLGGEKTISKTASSIINKLGHLFGDMTLFDDIKRIDAATIFSQNVFETYYRPELKSFKPEKIVEQINQFVNYWDYETRVLALSGGLDSRLVLAASKMKFGYTYGPAESSDRPVAEKFKNEFEKYYGFSIMEMKFYKNNIPVVNDIFSGVCFSPIVSLLPIYRHVRNYFGSNAYVTYDAFLGGVLQRGSFLNVSSGFFGHFLKIFPRLTCKFSAEKILKSRYRLLNDFEKDLLINDFWSKTKSMNLDEYHKVLYYEFAHGRGARLTSNGGIVMNSQFFTVAPPFTYIPLFENIFSANVGDTLSFKTVHQIWKEVAPKYSTIPTQLLFSPSSSPFVIKYQKLYKQVISKLIKDKYDYAGEIKKINWL